MSTRRDTDWDAAERAALAGLEPQIETMRARHAGDPPLDVLYAARHDVLPGEWQAQVDAHLRASAWSRALVEGLAAEPQRIADDEDRLDAETEARLLARIRREAGATLPRSTSRWPRALPVWIGATAAAAILVALVVWAPRNATAPSAPERAAGGAPAATEAPQARAAAPAAPFLLPFDKPDVRLSASALVWRGPEAEAPPGAQAYLRDLKPALDAYRAGDYAQADNAFARLRARYPRAIEICFYQGASRLLGGDPQASIEPLTLAEKIADSTFAPEVTLLLAVAEQRTGQADAARARLRRGCAPSEARTARVCAALKTLETAVPVAPVAR